LNILILIALAPDNKSLAVQLVTIYYCIDTEDATSVGIFNYCALP